MKLSLFSRFGYPAEAVPAGWPAAPRHWDPRVAADSLQRHLELSDLAVEHGFDMLTVAEHHYSPESLVPNPIVMASALAQRYPDVRLLVLGPVLPLWHPVRLAEDVAMLDMISGGRVSVGLFRGTLTELLAYGVGAEETKARFEEALKLVLRAWTEPEPFGWHGRYYRQRLVATWPRPVQEPHPPVYVAGGSPASAADAGRRRLRLGLLGQITPPAAASEAVAAYRDGAAEAGWEPAPEDVLWRGRIHVAETDGDADADRRHHRFADAAALVVPDGARGEVTRRIFAAATPANRRGGAPGRPPGASGIELIGGPDTVADQLAELGTRIGFGIADVSFDHPHLPPAKHRRSLELFVERVLPRVRSAGETMAGAGVRK